MAGFTYIKIQDQDRLRILTVDNPPMNVLSVPLLEELGKAVEEAGKDTAVRGLIITGGGNKAFSAGFDLKTLRDNRPLSIDTVRLGHKVFSKIETLPKVVIAAINGYAFGGGNELSMACDIRIAADHAQFGQPEVKVGLIAGWGGTQRLPRLIGPAKAKEMIFTGQSITAQEAQNIGLVNRVVAQGQELKVATEMALQIIQQCAPLAVAASKRAINEGLQKASMEEAIKVEIENAMQMSNTTDLKEGVSAFFNKRPPVFEGK